MFYGISTPIVNPARPFRSDTLANFEAYAQRVDTNLDVAAIAADFAEGADALSFILVADPAAAATYKGNAFGGDFPARIYVTAVERVGCPNPVQADFDGNCRVDYLDLEMLRACMTGPAIPYHSGNLPAGCTLAVDVEFRIAADFDDDGDVDQSDFGAFQRCYDPENAPSPDCAD